MPQQRIIKAPRAHYFESECRNVRALFHLATLIPLNCNTHRKVLFPFSNLCLYYTSSRHFMKLTRD